MTGYVVNPIAQRLAGGSNRIIGVFTYEAVFPGAEGDFYHPFLVGIEREAEARGCDLLLFTSAPVHDGRRRLLGDGARRLAIAAGCVLLGRHDDKRDLAELIGQGFPFVFVGRRESDAGPVPYVAADYASATNEVVDLLFAHGHERIGFIGELAGSEAIADRVTGYRDAMTTAGRRPVVLDGHGLDGVTALAMLRESGLTAVVTGADGQAEAIRRAALSQGLGVPGDLSVAQLGDPERPSKDDVDWTGFAIPREEMGAEALRVLTEVMAGVCDPGILQRSLPCAVVAGSTAGPVAPSSGGTGTKPPREATRRAGRTATGQREA